MSLKTDYKNDVLDTSVNTKRILNLVDQDGNIVVANVSIQDVTQYTQKGDSYGAADINATNEAVNNKFDSGDVVDPMETTEPGFAADAYKTRLQFEEVFQLGSNRKAEVIAALKNAGVGITDESTWEEIIIALQELFPNTFDALLDFTADDWALTGTQSIAITESSIILSCGTNLAYIRAQSTPIHMDGFKTLEYSWSAGDSSGTQEVQLVYSGGTLNVPSGTGTLDVSEITGEAYFVLYAKSESYAYNGTLYYSTAKTTVTKLKLFG